MLTRHLFELPLVLVPCDERSRHSAGMTLKSNRIADVHTAVAEVLQQHWSLQNYKVIRNNLLTCAI